ncbi:MAG TPA: hypothetical protein VLM89_05435, partial [Phycisphaerae bacterium]|nr:hypothetical protein [Phycisphaerae bacterium]
SELPQEAESRVARLVNEFKRDPDNHVLVRQFAFGGSRAIVLSARAEATRRATHLLYALHCEKNRTGKWPALLREIRGLSRVIRTDPFSGKDFCYRIENDQPLLYSVASNGRDDGGKHDPSWSELDRNGQPVNADYVFWPIQPHKR